MIKPMTEIELWAFLLKEKSLHVTEVNKDAAEALAAKGMVTLTTKKIRAGKLFGFYTERTTIRPVQSFIDHPPGFMELTYPGSITRN